MSQDHTTSTKPAEPETHGKHEDDVIVVPKGTSKSRFLMTALLAILVLTTFTVSGEVVDVFTGRNRAKSAYMSWKRPDGTVEEISAGDFIIKKQNMAKAMGLLSGGRNSSDHDDTQTAHHILADELAIEAGVTITDDEMSKIILQVFGTADTYKRRLADYRTTARDFEETLRSILRVRRYEMLLSQGFAEPDPKDIEKSWQAAHQEYSIQTVDLPTDGFATEAEAACPAGADLQAWFDALPDMEKGMYRRPIEAKTSAEFVWFSIEPNFTKSERLLAKYPRPETENADEVARTWYETNKDLFYVKAGLPPGKAREPGDYKPFEEVAEHARTAGTAYQSLLDWFNDMKVREETETKASLYEEGTAMGLGYRNETSTHTISEWVAAAMPFQGKAPLFAMFAATAEAGKLLPEVFVDPKGFFIGRLTGKEASRVPEFADYQDKVREGWIKKKKSELAKAKLEALVAKLPAEPDTTNPAGGEVHVEPDDAKFLAAAQELGLEVKTEDWFDAADNPEPGQNTPFRQFVRRTASQHGKTLGTVPAPEVSPDQKSAWLARVAGKRDPDVAAMTPQEYDSAKQMATYEARGNFLKSTFLSDDYLKEQYALDLEMWRRQSEDAAGTP